MKKGFNAVQTFSNEHELRLNETFDTIKTRFLEQNLTETDLMTRELPLLAALSWIYELSSNKRRGYKFKLYSSTLI